tara:strand:- start:3304 stop:3978 length:675 start_codon:yes stop_codon:yes gene_type:complete
MSNTINIGKHIVEIDTDIVYKAIEIDYQGNLSISNLLPNDYLVRKGAGKLIILRLNRGDDIYTELFRYYGACLIYGARLVDENNQIQNLTIEKNYIQTWNKLTTNWENLTTNYEDLTGGIRNDGVQKTMLVDNEDYTKTEKIVTTYPTKYKSDRNMKILGNQYTSNGNYRIKGKNTPYTGKFHIYLDTHKIMTGEMPEESSKQLIRTKGKKTKNLISNIRRRGY